MQRARVARDVLFSLSEKCALCPRKCGVNRLAGEAGYCRAPDGLMLASFCVQYGEEPPISGSRGSGTLFFSHCNLRCVFCQNHQISHHGMGRRYTALQVAECMLDLQGSGVHNINLVSPTPYAPWILEAVEIALGQGLSLPLVYNTHGYESLEVLDALQGVIDIYLPDLKYALPNSAERFSGALDYPETAKRAITLMYTQAGPLELDEQEIANRGLMVRHLVLPGHGEESLKVMDIMADLDPCVPVAVMSQYYPSHHAGEHPHLNRKVERGEYQMVVDYALELGMEHVLIQEPDSAELYLPDFRRRHPFHQ